jgi:hypothetical protein
MFVLLARDPFAPGLVREWARLQCENHEKINAALACADAMEEWRRANPPETNT